MNDPTGGDRPDGPGPDGPDAVPDGPGEDRPRDGEPGDDEPGDEQELSGLARNPVVHTKVDNVYADTVVFGADSARPGRRATGRVSTDEIRAGLRCYLPPEPFEPALAALRDHHLVLLAGEDGSGRRAGALALLWEVIGPDTDLVSLSPAYSLKDLADYPFRRDRGYLVADRLPDDLPEGVRRFEADRLRGRLRAAGARLVVTTSVAGARGWSGTVVDWRPPEPQELLDHCLTVLKVTMTDDQLAQARERVAQTPAPRDVVGLCDLLADDPDAALRSGDEQDRQRVREWLETSPGIPELAEAATAAFAHALPQRTFERIGDRLRSYMEERSGVDRTATTDPDQPVLPTRAVRDNNHGLTVITRDDPRSPRRVVLRSPAYRRALLAELAQRYGYELWGPLDRWLRELARTPDQEVLAQLSLGLALHARYDLSEVTALLDSWSTGVATERLTAAYVLSWLCLDEQFATTALATATRWAVGSGVRRAWTATVAFGGELGVRYPSEALRWLWHLVVHAPPARRTAVDSLAELFRDEDEPDTARTVLNFVRGRLDRAVETGGPAGQRPALRVALALVRTRRREVDQPVAAQLLLRQPVAADALGALWAALIASARHRNDAVTALRRTVELIGRDAAAERAVRALGLAVRRNWSTPEREVLLPQLEWAMRTKSTDEGRRLLSLLLDVLRQGQETRKEEM